MLIHPIDDLQLLNVRQVAILLDASEEFVRRHIRAELKSQGAGLKALRFGKAMWRIRRVDVKAFQDARDAQHLSRGDDRTQARAVTPQPAILLQHPRASDAG